MGHVSATEVLLQTKGVMMLLQSHVRVCGCWPMVLLMVLLLPALFFKVYPLVPCFSLQDGSSPLHLAAQFGRVKIARMLLAEGARRKQRQLLLDLRDNVCLFK